MIATVLTVLWSLLALLGGTAVLALGGASRTRLTEALKRVHRSGWLHRFDRYRREHLLTAQTYRLLAIVLLVVTLDAALDVTGTWGSRMVGLVAISALWLLVIGVAVPTAWARYAGESYLAAVLPALDLVRRLSRPLLAVINVVDEIVRRLAGAPPSATDPTEQMEREILDAVSEAEISGVVDKSARAMIKSAMLLDETSVGEIMTPRTEMIAIEAGAGLQQIRTLIQEAGHSRIPVYEGTMDRIVGVLYAKDLLQVTDAAAFSVQAAMRKAIFIPETKDVASLLREFQLNRIHIAIVLDEYGGTAGLVTIEDILEELVGEIVDEHDELPPPPIQRLDTGAAELDAKVRVEDVNEELGLRLPEDESYDTIGGFVFSKLGRIPTVGESFVEQNVRIEVLQADARRITRLRLQVLEEHS